MTIIATEGIYSYINNLHSTDATGIGYSGIFRYVDEAISNIFSNLNSKQYNRNNSEGKYPAYATQFHQRKGGDPSAKSQRLKLPYALISNLPRERPALKPGNYG